MQQNDMESSRLILGSPIDYNELVVYIWIDEVKVCLVHQEEGKDNLKIKFNEYLTEKEIDFALFSRALQGAKTILLDKPLT